VIFGIENDYFISLFESETPAEWDLSKLVKINSHRVSQEIIQKMMESYECDLTLDQILESESPFR